MRPAGSRFTRFAVPFLAFALTAPAVAQQAAAPAPAAVPWLYKGSDIPVDREWLFGELPNGLRYAVRRNGVPPRQVAIRVAIDAGSLMEQPQEAGFAHYNEHLSFRNSRYVPDGEAKRVWQRLGATFGSDTNASTTPTQTIYRLDLPNASPEGLDESVKILSGMLAAPNITQTGVDAERRTVLAELREGNGPQQRVGDATRQLFFAGQKLGGPSPIGTPETLAAATPETLKAFHDRWYRPDKTVVVIAGDGEPAQFEALIRKYFADWKPIGSKPADPDFGKPSATGPRAAVLVEPGLPMLVNLAVLRPWTYKDDTIEMNRARLIDTVATRLINRRLETRARAGGSFLSAGIDQDDVARSVDGTFIQIVPLGEDWAAAVRDVRGVIADALANPPSQADIDREANEFAAALQVGVETSRTESGGQLADTLIEAVAIRETVASAEVARDVFANMKPRLTPAAMMASTKTLLTGSPLRAVLTLPAPDPGAEARLQSVLNETVKPGRASGAGRPVSFDRVPKLGTPGTVVKRAPVSQIGIEFVELSNGTRLILFPFTAESGRIHITARFGAGRAALPLDPKSAAWAGENAIVASGVGTLGQDELDRLTSGRRINMSFDVGDDAFLLRASTRAADLDDQLKLLAAKLLKPGWDPNPVARAKAAALTGYATTSASPSAVLGRDLQGLLHGNDPRWSTPSRETMAALTPARFRALWEPLLATGPVELVLFGDFEADKAIAAAAASFGALPARPAPVITRPDSPPPVATPQPIVRTHTGAPDQAAAVLAWPTGGGLDDVFESRKLDVLSAIFNDRLFEQLREGEGASYSPSVSSQWPTGMPNGGSFVVTAQLRPEGTDAFFTLTRAIAADLAAKPVAPDELARAVGPMRQQVERASSGATFWLSQLSGATRDPRKLTALATLTADLTRITPADVQAAARRWLVSGKEFRMIVVPEKR